MCVSNISSESFETNLHTSSPSTPNISVSQCAFPKNKDLYLPNCNKIIKFRKLTWIQYYHPIYRPY